jgi:hypothetical protein
MIPKFQAYPHIEMCRELEEYIPNPFNTVTKAEFLKTQEFLLDRETFLPLVDKFFTLKIRNELYMAPRGTYKTTLFKTFLVYVLLLFREVWGTDVSTLYMRDVHKDAKGLLGEIKADLARGAELQEYFQTGGLEDEADEWSSGTVNWSGNRDPSITTAGVTMGRTGTHPCLIILDDMVNDNNYGSPLKIGRAWNAIGQFEGTMAAGQVRIVGGTPFTKNDCYARIRKMNAEARENQKKCEETEDWKGYAKAAPVWHEFIRPAHNTDGTLFFPALQTEEFLEEKKRSMDAAGLSKLFASWFLMSPTVEGEELFLPEYKQWGDYIYNAYPRPQLQIVTEGNAGEPFPVNIYMRVDPALTAKTGSHKHGICVMATDRDFNKYVLFTAALREVPSKIVSELSRIVDKFRPPLVIIEAEMNNPAVTAGLQKFISDNKLAVTIDMPKKGATRVPKPIRIGSLQPWYRARTVFWQRGQACAALQSEYDLWPDVADGHADALDAHAGMVEMAEAYEGDEMVMEGRAYRMQLEAMMAEVTEEEEFGSLVQQWAQSKRSSIKTGVR